VEDLGSPGGTFVNGLRVEQPMLAWPGDRVVLGRASLEIRPRPPAVPALQAVAGPAAGRSLVVDRPVELGRGPTAGFVLEGDELVSRLHARVSPVDGGLLVEDLGSRNGTTVNGEPVTRPTRLELGDVVGIGETLLKVVRAEDLAAPATAVRSAPGADEP
jgi:pSer/pThr/pTyr-binding forkhead associated (FHA) protein